MATSVPVPIASPRSATAAAAAVLSPVSSTGISPTSRSCRTAWTLVGSGGFENLRTLDEDAELGSVRVWTTIPPCGGPKGTASPAHLTTACSRSQPVLLRQLTAARGSDGSVVARIRTQMCYTQSTCVTV